VIFRWTWFDVDVVCALFPVNHLTELAPVEWRSHRVARNGENKEVLFAFVLQSSSLESRVFVFKNEIENQWDVKMNRALA
jgi:hypothetical protein